MKNRNVYKSYERIRVSIKLGGVAGYLLVPGCLFMISARASTGLWRQSCIRLTRNSFRIQKTNWELLVDGVQITKYCNSGNSQCNYSNNDVCSMHQMVVVSDACSMQTLQDFFHLGGLIKFDTCKENRASSTHRHNLPKTLRTNQIITIQIKCTCSWCIIFKFK